MVKNDKSIITGIDVGTTKIAVIIAEYSEDSKITILGYGMAPSFGLKKGEVVDVPKTRESLDKAIKEAEEKADCKIDSAFIGITGDHINGINYSGVVTVDQGDGLGSEIEDEDIVKVRERTRSISLPSERDILHVLDQEYRVDEQNNIDNPKGLYGRRLELNAHLVTIAKSAVHNLKNCFSRDIQINSFVLEPLASAYAVLNKQQRDLGTVLIDIGGGTTDIIIYENNGVQYSGAIPLGGNIITKDIALGVQQYIGECLDGSDLETLKHDYGSAKKECVDENKKITLTIDNRELSINEYQLADIIQSRMIEIFEEVKRKINQNNISNKPYGIVITGGGSQLRNIQELASEIFQQTIIIGYPKNINGPENITKNPRFSTAIGLIRFGIKSLEVDDVTERLTIKTTMKDLFRNLKRLYNRWY